MTKQLIEDHPKLTFPIASLSDREPARRFIVLIPDMEFDSAFAAQRIWKLANATSAHVQFLGLCTDAAQEPSLRRKLIALSALVQDGGIPSEVKVEIGTSWMESVKRNYQKGDTIVCFEEQRAGLLHRPLNQILNATLDAPVYVLSNPRQRKTKPNWSSQIFAWSGSLGVIIGFGILQAKIGQLPKDGFQSILLILSIIPEFWLVWVWNDWFR
jgi:hypothetical protein